MKCTRSLLALAALVIIQLAPLARAQDPEGFGLDRDTRERQDRFTKLSLEDQLKLRSAQTKALQDPVVKAAMEKRDAAIKEFRASMRASMIAADPTMTAILDRIGGIPR